MLKTNRTNQSNDSPAFSYAYTDCFTTTYYGTIFLFCMMSLCFLVGTPAHSWCLWFYLRDGWRIKANQMFQFHHIIMELIGCVENAIQLLNEFVFYNETVFYVDNFIFGVSWTGRPLIQTCICIEQYIAVFHPIIFLKYKDIKYKLAGVVTVYLISTCYGVYEIINSAFNPIFTSIYVLVVIIVLYCCVSVLCALKTSGPGDKHGNRSTAQEEPNQQKKKAFNIICTNLCIMLLSYVPMLVLTICYVIKDHKVLYYCILAPVLSSTSPFSLIITPLLKMHKKGYLRCFQLGN